MITRILGDLRVVLLILSAPRFRAKRPLYVGLEEIRGSTLPCTGRKHLYAGQYSGANQSNYHGLARCLQCFNR